MKQIAAIGLDLARDISSAWRGGRRQSCYQSEVASSRSSGFSLKSFRLAWSAWRPAEAHIIGLARSLGLVTMCA